MGPLLANIFQVPRITTSSVSFCEVLSVIPPPVPVAKTDSVLSSCSTAQASPLVPVALPTILIASVVVLADLMVKGCCV